MKNIKNFIDSFSHQVNVSINFFNICILFTLPFSSINLQFCPYRFPLRVQIREDDYKRTSINFHCIFFHIYLQLGIIPVHKRIFELRNEKTLLEVSVMSKSKEKEFTYLNKYKIEHSYVQERFGIMFMYMTKENFELMEKEMQNFFSFTKLGSVTSNF